MDEKKKLELDLNELNQKPQKEVKEKLQGEYHRLKSLDRPFGGKYEKIKEIHQEAINSIGSSLEKDGVLQISQYFQECDLKTLMEYGRFLNMVMFSEESSIYIDDLTEDNERKNLEIVGESKIDNDERQEAFAKMEWVMEAEKAGDNIKKLSDKITKILKYRTAKILVTEYDKYEKDLAAGNSRGFGPAESLVSALKKLYYPAIEAGYSAPAATNLILSLSSIFEVGDLSNANDKARLETQLKEYQIDGSSLAKNFILSEKSFPTATFGSKVKLSYERNIKDACEIFKSVLAQKRNKARDREKRVNLVSEYEGQIMEDLIKSAKQYSGHPIDIYAQLFAGYNGQGERNKPGPPIYRGGIPGAEHAMVNKEYAVDVARLKEELEIYGVDNVYKGVDVLKGGGNKIFKHPIGNLKFDFFNYASSVIQQDIDFLNKFIGLPALDRALSSEQKEELQRPISRIIPPKKDRIIPPKKDRIIPPKKDRIIPPKKDRIIPPKKDSIIPPKKGVVESPNYIKKPSNNVNKDSAFQKRRDVGGHPENRLGRINVRERIKFFENLNDVKKSPNDVNKMNFNGKKGVIKDNKEEKQHPKSIVSSPRKSTKIVSRGVGLNKN